MEALFKPAQPHLDRRPHIRRLLGEQHDVGSAGLRDRRQVSYMRPEYDKDVFDLSAA